MPFERALAGENTGKGAGHITRLHVHADKDRQFVDALRIGGEGARKALEALFREYNEAFIRIAKMYAHGSAEDIVQDSWIAIMEGIHGFRGESSFYTWACRIVANKAKTRGTRDARQKDGIDAEVQYDMEEGTANIFDSISWRSRFRMETGFVPPEIPTPEVELLRLDTMQFIAEELEKLSPKQRQTVRLHDIEGVPRETVMNRMGVTYNYFRVLLHRGRGRIRKALEAQGIIPDDLSAEI